MMKKILAISGKPGLYRLVSHGNRSLIVETLEAKPKRMPVFATDKVVSLADIAMYTDSEEVPLPQVLDSIKEKEQGGKASVDYRKASSAELSGFMASVLPNYDRDRVHTSDIRKLIQWYDMLVENGVDDFSVEQENTSEAGQEQA
ncbi:MAG TPA: hypothetical protein DDW22_06130 [Prevotellaceae bacterium]|nr:hypothetical protein [Prevotellaceae bacterium]